MKTGKIRVAYFRTQFWFGLEMGGSVSHTLGVLKGFKENNCDVKIFSNDYFLGIEDHNHFVIKPGLFRRRLLEVGEFLYNLYTLKRFKREVEKYGPDFVYHRYSSKTFFVCRLAKSLGIPIVLEVNSYRDWLSIFGIYRKNILKKFLNNVFRKKLLRLIEEYDFKNSSMIVVVSKVVKNSLIEIGIPGEKILVIPNAADIDKFNPRISGSNISKNLRKELNIGKNNIVLGFVGTFGPWHGIEHLVSAIERIERDNKNKDIIFLLMGDGVLRKYAVDRIDRFSNVMFTGSVPYTKIQNYLSICDILVSPHGLQPDGKEFIGSPTKLFEYMAMGKGIVASDLGQIGEVLKNGRTAILVKPGNIEELAGGILKLVDDEKLRSKLGRNAATEVCNKYTWDKNIKKLLNFMNSSKILS